ncbi:GntR family transcriptional regulator [Streptomyces sp. NA02950]|uniref:GntR family transcriptional regulator n=1 Tax=Streptomyces sp. NA02950 TaxID=2742137 RepID=UPI001590CEEE|nr:GntR family transcriptional regulator [Streptomyces sp. NA02950]QKV97046.1 GntR family transcriptional regulator [Streptomyces sp. NA02950]
MTGSRPRTNYEFARQTLRSDILDGRVQPGSRLVQTELAARLGVSTTPVREAIQDLAREGLVTLDPHRGAFVRSLSLAEVREIYELRIVLEPMLLRRAAEQLDKAALDQAERLYEQMAEEHDLSRWAELNQEFHHILFAPAEDSRLAGIVAGLRDSATPYVALSLREPDQQEHSNAEHIELLGLLRAQDIEAAEELTRRHLAATLGIIEQSYDSTGADRTLHG